jgi:hypothetical protein
MAEHFRGVVSVKLNENVKLENLQAIVGQIAGMTGCRTCGLLGIDLRLTGDPAEVNQIATLAGVKSVAIGG